MLGSALIAASIYLSYRFAERIGRTLGDSAMNVIIRLSSFSSSPDWQEIEDLLCGSRSR